MNRVILGGAFIIIAVLGVFGVFNGRNDTKKLLDPVSSATAQNINLQGDMSISGLKSLDFSSVSADISIERVSGSTVKVLVTGRSKVTPDLLVEKSGSNGSFRIKWPKNINLNTQDMKMSISLPRDYEQIIRFNTVSGDIALPENGNFEQLQSTTVSGNVQGKEIEAGQMSFSTVSGDLRVVQAVTNRIDISSTSGDIDFSGLAGNIQVETVSGDSDITLDALDGDIKSTSVSGDVELNLPQSISATILFSSVSGDLTTEIPIMTTGSKKGVLSGTIGSGEFKIEGSSVSGDISIRKK